MNKILKRIAEEHTVTMENIDDVANWLVDQLVIKNANKIKLAVIDGITATVNGDDVENISTYDYNDTVTLIINHTVDDIVDNFKWQYAIGDYKYAGMESEIDEHIRLMLLKRLNCRKI
jgi:hypothetical protein